MRHRQPARGRHPAGGAAAPALTSDTPFDGLIRLVEAAEERYPYVSLERLRRLARADAAWSGLAGRIVRRVREALAAGLLLSDSRTRLTRTGRFEPIEIYRLNRRHPKVAKVLGAQITFCGRATHED